jgi:prepilin-type processing-associated H-X9-DG protein
VELLVVIAIIALLAAILFPVFQQAKAAGKATTCLANIREIGLASQLYLTDNNDFYPQTKTSSDQPDIDDIDGGLDDPDYGSVFALLSPYVGKAVTNANLSKVGLYACPTDPAPFDPECDTINEQAPPVISYLVNAYFVFGLNETTVPQPASTIICSERRSQAVGSIPQFCDYLYHPWFSPLNPLAPANEMDAILGAVATTRHFQGSNFAFVDGHVKALAWSRTYSPPNIDLHTIPGL